MLLFLLLIYAKEYPVLKTCQTVKLASEMRLANGRQAELLAGHLAMHGINGTVGSSPSQDWREPDNQSPMKQDNRDHWTLFSANLQHLFQLPPTTSTLQPLYTSLYLLSEEEVKAEMTIDWSKTTDVPGFLRKICRNICWKKSTGCFADA